MGLAVIDKRFRIELHGGLINGFRGDFHAVRIKTAGIFATRIRHLDHDGLADITGLRNIGLPAGPLDRGGGAVLVEHIPGVLQFRVLLGARDNGLQGTAPFDLAIGRALNSDALPQRRIIRIVVGDGANVDLAGLVPTAWHLAVGGPVDGQRLCRLDDFTGAVIGPVADKALVGLHGGAFQRHHIAGVILQSGLGDGDGSVLGGGGNDLRARRALPRPIGRKRVRRETCDANAKGNHNGKNDGHERGLLRRGMRRNLTAPGGRKPSGRDQRHDGAHAQHRKQQDGDSRTRLRNGRRGGSAGPIARNEINLSGRHTGHLFGMGVRRRKHQRGNTPPSQNNQTRYTNGKGSKNRPPPKDNPRQLAHSRSLIQRHNTLLFAGFRTQSDTRIPLQSEYDSGLGGLGNTTRGRDRCPASRHALPDRHAASQAPGEREARLPRRDDSVLQGGERFQRG